MNKTYIGIDIGINGGIVALDHFGNTLSVVKTPNSFKAYSDHVLQFKDINPFAIMEHVHSQPQNGSKANFTFGRITERTQNALLTNNIPFIEVPPQQWLKLYQLKKNKSESNTQWKNRLKAKAQQLFPNEKITLWNADAFLIAFYNYSTYKN